MRVGVRDRVIVMVMVRVLVLDGVSDLVGTSVSDAVKVGLDVLVGVRDTNAPNVESPIAIIVPLRKPIKIGRAHV